jgi:hypothetical protein
MMLSMPRKLRTFNQRHVTKLLSLVVGFGDMFTFISESALGPVIDFRNFVTHSDITIQHHALPVARHTRVKMDDQVDRLTTLPHELLHNIFKHIDPLQLAGLAIQCRALRGFISNNTQLFKDIFVQYFVSSCDILPAIQG